MPVGEIRPRHCWEFPSSMHRRQCMYGMDNQNHYFSWKQWSSNGTYCVRNKLLLVSFRIWRQLFLKRHQRLCDGLVRASPVYSSRPEFFFLIFGSGRLHAQVQENKVSSDKNTHKAGIFVQRCLFQVLNIHKKKILDRMEFI